MNMPNLASRHQFKRGSRRASGRWPELWRIGPWSVIAVPPAYPALFDYPVGRPDSISYRSPTLTGDAWVEPSLKGRWFPDGFVGTMAGLMRALDEGQEPPHSGRDNLRTLALVFAAYRSMAEHRPVRLVEIAASLNA
jgi:predicted dehydrogenase